MGIYFNLKKNNQYYLVAICPNSWKTLKVLAVIVYLHSQKQRFFVDVSFKFSNDRCRYMYTAYGNFAILLFLMHLLWTICWHYKILIFEVSLDINGQLRQKVKEFAYTILTLPEAKRFMFYHVFPFPFESGYRFKTFFSIIM